MAHRHDEPESATSGGSGVTMIDHRAPRFGQTITMSVLLLGIILQEPVFILVIAIILNAAIFTGWRVNLYGYIWRNVMIPLVGPPEQKEPAAPHRFAKIMGASMSAVATILLYSAPIVSLPSVAILGYAVALMHAGAAAIGGIGNYCIGCRMYKQVAFFRRLGVA